MLALRTSSTHAAGRRRPVARHASAPASPLVDHVLDVQRRAGNRAVASSIAAIQRRKSRGHVEVISGEEILGADALEAILFQSAREERLGDLPSSVRAAGERLLRCLHGRTADGAPLPLEEQLSLYLAAHGPLEAMLGRALAASDGDLPSAAHARRGLAGLHDSLVATRATSRAAEEAKAAELVSPRVKAERMTLAATARKTLDIYVMSEELLASSDFGESESKELRGARIAGLKGIIALCDTDDWPSYTKLVDDVDKQLARTDPDRMLGAGAAVLDHVKKAVEWTTSSLTLVGMGMKAALMGRGMIQQAAAVGDALAGLEKLSGALAVIDVLHGAMVLLDSGASGSEKVGAALEVASGGISVTGTIAGAAGAESVAAVAGRASPWAMAVTINYKAYKALAEYTYSSVVGGLAMVDVSESMEGAPISTKGGTFRPGGLDDLGKAVTEARLRVESLERQLGAAPAGEGGGVQRAMGDQVSRLQRAIHGLQHQWSIAPLDAVRAYMPTWDLGSQNAMDPAAEPWMVIEEARRWEDALRAAFTHKQEIVEATMHQAMARS
jgi:hypothetical protein